MGDFSSSSSAAEADDFSLFLRQILRRSSSSPSDLMAQNGGGMQRFLTEAHGAQPPYLDQKCCGGSFRLSPTAGDFLPANGSPALGVNDSEEYGGESEDNSEALIEEATTKSSRLRSSSKRSRAAEVHNLSEKRRRNRINEKMKALQKLIPNSNKTDKASMLDEAIEYLKQLQLRVQMLTMRNGLSLHPMCLPRALQASPFPELNKTILDENGSSHNLTPRINQSTFGQDNHRRDPRCADFSNTIDLEASFESRLPIQGNVGPFQRPISSKGIHNGEMQSCQQINQDHSLMQSVVGRDVHNLASNPKEWNVGAKSAASIPFKAQAFDPKNDTLEACIYENNNPGMHVPELPRH